MRIRRRVTGRRGPLVAGLAVVAGLGVAACEPVGGLSASAVAYTTDRAGTAELQRRHVDVQYLSCTGSYGGGNKAYTPGHTPSASTSTPSVVEVDCRGQTKDRREITLTGKVTREVEGKCVRGNLTAKVGGKEWFHVNVLGNCDAASTPSYTSPTYKPPTYKPPTYNRPGPTTTVTVTKTMWCKGDPTCWPSQGK
ncbi:hypothetical protein OG762_14165 [Streptomyces sp. NBC_01136]|uniref:hypothetical protein n=1 Tax=unclassified Streptomyces TaxID=2593676 RepID=UPI003247A89B|nr:hypothetical protein OG762_14165 [Streptomyces sp. NBC_01136]